MALVFVTDEQESFKIVAYIVPNKTSSRSFYPKKTSKQIFNFILHQTIKH